MKKLAIILVVCLLSCFPEYVTYKDIEAIIIKECKKYPCPIVTKYLVHAIMYWESRDWDKTGEWYKTTAKSVDNCIGLMQIKSNTLDYFNYRKRIFHDRKWKDWTMEDMKDPWKNIHVGIFCLVNKLKITNFDLHKALRLYSGNAENYSVKVLTMMYKFRKLDEQKN